jgi:hypothetical protein
MTKKRKNTKKRSSTRRKTTSGKKMTKTRLAAQGKEIIRIAKRIRKQNPRKKWTTCMSEAGKEYKRNH